MKLFQILVKEARLFTCVGGKTPSDPCRGTPQLMRWLNVDEAHNLSQAKRPLGGAGSWDVKQHEPLERMQARNNWRKQQRWRLGGGGAGTYVFEVGGGKKRQVETPLFTGLLTEGT